MTLSQITIVTILALLSIVGCGAPRVSGPGIPEAIRVLENPATGERVRFFREISFKVPKNYDEGKHLAEWTAEQQSNGFTKDIKPTDDRTQLAELRQKNLAAARSQ